MIKLYLAWIPLWFDEKISSYLGSGRCSDFRVTLDINSLIDMFIDFSDSIEKFRLEDFL